MVLQEPLRPGCTVSVTGPGLEDCTAEILSLSEDTGQATVRLVIPPTATHYPRPADTLQVCRVTLIKPHFIWQHSVPVHLTPPQVPLSRLEAHPPPRPLVLAPAAGPLLEALQSLLLPDTAGLDPLSVPLPSKVRM